MKSQTGLVEGDRIILEGAWGIQEEYTVERFRDCLGVFKSDESRRAGDFLPLCEMYGHGAGSSSDYIPNYGSYTKNPVALWMQVPRVKLPEKGAE